MCGVVRPNGMSNGFGDSSYGVVTNVKASVLPYTHGASEEGHCPNGGWLLHSYRTGHVRRCCGASQRGVDIGPQVIDLC